MGKITIRETSSVDNGTSSSHSEVEYIFEDSSDYFAWSEQKAEAINNAVKAYVGGLDFGSAFETPLEEESADNVTEIKVAKKIKEPTKH
jgi:hypothetical protein